MLKRILALGAAGAIAVGLAACGDDDGDDTSATDTTTATAISEDDFVAQADQICADGDADIDEQADAQFGNGEPSQADLEAFASDTLVPGIQSQIDAIEALGAPEGQEDQVAQFLQDAQEALDGVEADPSQITGDPFAEVVKEAEALGLTECAN